MLQCSEHAVFVSCVWIVTCACVSHAVFDEKMWRLCLTTLEWTSIEVSPDGALPSARFGHVMTSVGLDLWMYGGWGVGEGDSCATHVTLLVLAS